MPRRSVHKAPFISFEGGEGAGKTTQSELLRRRLESMNLPVIVVREPGSTRLGEEVRDIIKSSSGNVPAADALLFMAARAQLMHDVIVPELNRGTAVICDRFSDSMMAYQGFGGKLNLDRLRHANELATNEVVPDLTLLLDISPETGLLRRDASDQSNGETHRRFEELPLRFHRNVRRGYSELADREPNRWVKINASMPPREVAEDVWRYVSDLFDLG
jgi:dTMP kinase